MDATTAALQAWFDQSISHKDARVGKGRVSHFSSGNDETLCGKPISTYLTRGEALDMAKICDPCWKRAIKLGAEALANKGEGNMPKNETAEQAVTVDQLKEEIQANIERVRSLAEADNADGAAELATETEALITSLKGNQNTKLRKDLREELSKAGKAEPAKSTELAVKEDAAPATTYHDIEGMDELVRHGADKVSEGIKSLARGSEVAKDVAMVILEMRCHIVNPKTGLPDLRADTDNAKQASKDMFAIVEEGMKAAGTFNEEAFDSFKRGIRRQTQHTVVQYVTALDHNPDVVDQFFKKAIERNPDMKPTDAVRKECRIPEKSDIDKQRERQAEKRRLAEAKKALELTAGGEEADMDAEEAQAIVEAATVSPMDKAVTELNKTTKAWAATLKATGQLSEDELATFKDMLGKWLETATVAKAEL